MPLVFCTFFWIYTTQPTHHITILINLIPSNFSSHLTILSLKDPCFYINFHHLHLIFSLLQKQFNPYFHFAQLIFTHQSSKNLFPTFSKTLNITQLKQSFDFSSITLMASHKNKMIHGFRPILFFPSIWFLFSPLTYP